MRLSNCIDGMNYFFNFSDCLQLRPLKASDVQRLLHKVLQSNQNEFCHIKWETSGSGQQYPPAGWLEEVWLYLYKNFPSCLDPFQGLHLIQVETSSESTILAQLQKRTTLVVREVNGSGLNEAMSNILRKLGLTIIDALPDFTITHPQCFQFVNKPTIQGIIKAFSVIDEMGTNDLVRRIEENISPNEKRQFRSFLAQANSFTIKEEQLVSRLPLFETLDGSGKKDSFFVAASQVRRAAPAETLPVSPTEIFINAKDYDCRKLAKALEIKQLTTMELLSVDVLPGVARNYYLVDELDCLMVFVLERLPQYRKENKNFDQYLRSLPFVSRSSDGRRVKPSDLFDPNVKVLRNIFLSEDEHFPSKTYRDDIILVEMRKLGLKTVKEITANMILESVKQVERMLNNIEAECKSKAILTFLNKNPSILRDRVSSGMYLADAIRSIRWVSGVAVKPSYYPDNLPFYADGTSSFYRPDCMVANTKRLLSLVGTIRPSVQADLYPKLKDHFYWESEPKLEDVIAQFKSVTSTYLPQCKASYLSIVIEIYEYLSSKDHRCVNKALITSGIERWMWNGEAFSSPDKIVVGKPFTDLSPYAYSLPSEMKTFKTMFLKYGVKVKEDQELLVTVLHQMQKKYEDKTNVSEKDVKHDLQLSIDILNEIKPSSGKEMPREILEKLLLPIDVDNNFTLRLHPIKDCTYCDTEWLKHDYETYEAEEDDDVGLHYLHRNVPPSTAQRLGVPSLMSRILDPDQLGFGEEYGQSEPLTRRLNRLLEDYTDGFAVPKELIQNADDAGATEVKILYDERSNMEARTCLIDEGMQGWQGQALWAYNDAVFTDNDFENITKLSEGSKEKDSGKIGRFGLGFNAVYNLTDVPSFVSRNKIVIFDPHTTYLGKAVRNKQKPGIKIDIMKNQKKLRKLRNQFKPYNGIFGCDLSLDAEETFFNGTLFRFPLRNRSQADKSEIKSLFYDKEQMTKLLEMVVKGADTLLLFTQNVRRVTLFHLPSDAKDPSEAIELFQIKKKPINTLCGHGVNIKLSDAAIALSIEEQSFIKECNFLKATSQVMQNIKQGHPMNEPFPQSSVNISVVSSFTKAGHVFFANVPHTYSQLQQAWLVSSSMGQDMSFEKAKGDERLRPAAGVAVRLVEDNYTSLVSHMNPAQVTGCVFCYLPLPINSRLSVHINGGFAVTSNRRYLKERSNDDKDESGGEWNEMLLKDAVCKAYLSAMQNLRRMMDLNSSVQSFYELWPLLNTAECLFDPLVRSFYAFLVQNSLELFTDGKRWVDIEHALFLKPELRQIAGVGDVALDVLRQVSSSEKVVIDLPSSIAESLDRCGYGAVLSRNSYDVVRFYSEIFFPHIEALDPEERDILTLYALHANSKDLDEFLKKSGCIPVTPDGKKLKSPEELVHPTGEIASVFLPQDEKFPYGFHHTYLNDVILAKLVHLGMAKDEMRWDMIVERAQSGVSLNLIDHDAAVKRGAEICRLLDRKLSRRHSEAVPVSYEEEKHEAQEKLLEIPFLPVLTPPKNFPFAWKTTGSQLLVSAKEAYPSHKQNLVCASAPLIRENLDGKKYLTKVVKRFLKLNEKTVPKDIVFNQLKQAMSQENTFENKIIYNYILNICTDVYDYLQSKYDDLSDEEKAFLRQEKVILTRDGFVSTSYVACESSFNFSPYLYSLADTAAATFTKLGVENNFNERHYVTTLRRIKENFGTISLDTVSLKLVVELLEELARCIEGSKDRVQAVELGSIYFPDSESILHMASDLCINDCLWVPKKPGVRYTHPKIPPETCKVLGVKTTRTANLTSCSKGIPFGQKEKLTNRLKGILDAYPCGQDVLKELLQNADDAQATEICFISDPRHHKDHFIFEDSWKPLQGPALLVYNNKPFTKSDLSGIQNLGEGSKRDDPNKTGQYGVGFNCVYHLTDVPSFLSNGAEIGEVLCAFDPHCRYVPGATPEEPGRMFDIDELEKLYTDVFPCYKLGNSFPLKEAVMFRFPLRTNEMAETSDISSSEMTQEDLRDLMNKFKNEMFEYLLFVNNVKEISLWEVDEISGEPVECYRVKASIEPEDEKKRQEFGMNARRVSQQLKKGEKLLSEIEMKEITYVMTIEDSRERKEDWLVVQRTGFEKKTEIPESVFTAYDKKELGLLPRGGVATVLNSTSPMSHQMKAYCFLPLPQETGLPVNINGHFALDHEARRNLWQGEDSRGEWNKVLLQGVIAPCYVTTLCRARYFLQLEPNGDHVTRSTCTRQEMTLRLTKLCDLLPGIEETPKDFCWKSEKEFKAGSNAKYPPSDRYWIALTQYVYQYINQHQVRILPVLRGFDSKSNTSRNPKKVKHSFAVYWFFPCGKGKDEAFFNDLQNFPCPPSNIDDDEKRKSRQEMQEEIQLLLLRTGFNLVKFPLSVYEAFRMSGVNVSLTSPSAVIEFYKSFNKEESPCNIGCIPAPIASTPFKNEKFLFLVLHYCKTDNEFSNKLNGLPLLLTCDNQLRCFSGQSPTFISRFYNLLPECSEMFVHPKLHEIFCEPEFLTHDVFKEFDVKEFASLLSHTISQEKFYEKSLFSGWVPNQKTLPNQEWLQTVWRFLSDQVKNMLKVRMKEKLEDMEKERKNENPDSACRKAALLSNKEEKQEITVLFEPLKDWSILPAKEVKSLGGKQPQTNNILVPLKLGKCILEFRIQDQTKQCLCNILRELGLPELNRQALESTYMVSSSRIARKFVATLDEPTTVLEALNQQMKRLCMKGKLKHEKAKSILTYFNDNVENLRTPEHIEILKRLPLHETIHGSLIEIAGQTAIVLPPLIPSDGIGAVEKCSRVAFLKKMFTLQKLHDFMGCKPISPVDVYCDVIFQYFHKIKKQGKINHLNYIRNDLLPKLPKQDKEGHREKLISGLSNLEFLPKVKSHSYGKVSSFYDPRVPVFKVMLSPEVFPPKPFDEPEWLDFLCDIGLIKNVTKEKFLEFANEVAREAKVSKTEETIEKSKTLVDHLFSRTNLSEDEEVLFLHKVSSIPFITSEEASQELSSLHPQYQLRSDGQLPYSSFSNAVAYKSQELVWTTAQLLPEWASPGFYFSMKDRKRAISLIKGLSIVEKPSLEQVTQHCINLCNKLIDENDKSESFDEKRFDIKTKVMSQLYRYFQSNISSNHKSGQTRDNLQNIPCILVESGKRFVYPHQVVIECSESQEIKPYLYAIPKGLAQFRNFFELVGSPRKVGCREYAMVLQMIHQLWPQKISDPNALKQLLIAVKGFFKCVEELESSFSPESLKVLYLPGYTKNDTDGSKPLPVFLRQAKSLIYNDAPCHNERLKQFSEMLLLDLKDCGIKKVNIKDDLLTKIPEKHRPKLLSEVVKEELVASSCSAVPLGGDHSLKKTLVSQEFCRGIVRLIRHENHVSGVSTMENIVTSIERKLQNIGLYGMEKVVTHLEHEGKVIPGSQKEVPHFQTEEIKGNEIMWKIYLNKSLEKSEEMDSFLSIAITSAIETIACGQLQKTTTIVSKILEIPIHKIWSFLDQMKIRQDDSYDPSQSMPLPEPGSFIPIEDHHLLDNAFNEFDVGDYAGLEVFDTSDSEEDDDATFIYVIVMEKFQKCGVNGPALNYKYKINIGCNRDPEVVTASKLYKFHKVIRFSPENCVVFTDEENPPKPQDRQEIFMEITQILEEAWKLSEEERRRIIKRLYLRWHPDKNLGNEEFCKEVCHYIQSEINRLSSRTSCSYGSSGVFYGNLYTFSGKRASRHRKSRNRYRDAFVQSYPRGSVVTSQYVPPSFQKANPQPQEAKRWLRQAEMDLEAASNDKHVTDEYYEWACFKHHQVSL